MGLVVLIGISGKLGVGFLGFWFETVVGLCVLCGRPMVKIRPFCGRFEVAHVESLTGRYCLSPFLGAFPILPDYLWGLSSCLIGLPAWGEFVVAKW